MSSLNIGNICELPGESEHFSVSTVDEVTVYINVRSNTHNKHPSVTPSAAQQLKHRLHPHIGI